MRIAGALLIAGIALPSTAFAGSHHGDSGPEVHDHRSGGGSSGGSSEPVVRDHRSSDSSSAPVVRDHRGGGGGGGGGNGGGGGSSGGSSSYYEPVSTVDYVEVDNSPPVSPFANYNGPAWTLEVGGLAHRFRGPAWNRSGSVETVDGGYSDYRISSGTPTAGDTGAGGFDVRMTVPTSQHLYLGADLELGALSRSPLQLMEGSPDLRLGAQTMVGSAAVVGTRVRHGATELDGEVAGGVRVFSASVQSMYSDETTPSATETAVSPLLEARLRGVLWVTPHFFFSGQVGVSALDRDDVNVGLAFGISSRGFAQPR